MRRLLSKIENRKLYMIELLYQKNDYMPIEDLAAELQTSVRNLKEDIAEMDNLSDILTITLLQDKVKMEFHQNTGVESVTQYLINHNFSYKLLEEMFLMKHCIWKSWQNLCMSVRRLFTGSSERSKMF